MNSGEKFDVLIAGGGVIGLAIARELRRSGVEKIGLVERGEMGSEASYAAAGMLAPDAETEEIDAFYRLCRRSLELYPAFAEELKDETGIDIELDRSGTLFAAFTENDSAEIARRFDSQKRAGLKVVHLTAAETRKAEPFISPDVRESLFFPDDWQVENRRLLAALRKYAELNGITLIENTEVMRLSAANGRVNGAETASGIISADTTIIATGAWASLIKIGDAAMPFTVKPIRGQIVSYHTAKRLVECVIYSPRGYIVPRADGRILAGATVEDVGFDKSVTEAGTVFLKEVAFEIVPNLSGLEVQESWAGLRPFVSDGKPVIGDIAGISGLVIAAGHYRNGILLAPETARLVADRITGRRMPESLGPFSPNRFRAAHRI